MEHKVFVLHYYLSPLPDMQTGKHRIQGNLDELNELLDANWVIKSFSVLAPQGIVQNILYHLCETPRGENIPV